MKQRNHGLILVHTWIFFQVIKARYGAFAHVVFLIFAFVVIGMVSGIVMTEGTRLLVALSDGKLLSKLKAFVLTWFVSNTDKFSIGSAMDFLFQVRLIHPICFSVFVHWRANPFFAERRKKNGNFLRFRCREGSDRHRAGHRGGVHDGCRGSRRSDLRRLLRHCRHDRRLGGLHGRHILRPLGPGWTEAGRCAAVSYILLRPMADLPEFLLSCVFRSLQDTQDGFSTHCSSCLKLSTEHFKLNVCLM